jgi:hypothetical protein
VEDGGRNSRLRLGPGRAHCPDRPRRGSHLGRLDIGPWDQFTIAFLTGFGRRCARHPTPDSFSDARSLSDPRAHSIVQPGGTFASTFAQARAAAIAEALAQAGAATITATCEHVRSALKPVGLQLLWREPDLQPTLQLLLVLQLHPKFLEEHGRLRG